MTALYNVLKEERRGGLDKQEHEIHEEGPGRRPQGAARRAGRHRRPRLRLGPDLPEEEILQRLVDLNAGRRAEEEEGHVRYLRSEY